jgi:ribonuclease P protein component
VDKLTLRADFDAVMAAGVVARTSHFALHQQSQTATSRIGAVVPKRWARKAVTRNLIKRQIYALVREPWTTNLPWADRVIRLRKTFDNKLFISASSENLRLAIRSELHQLMDQLMRKGVAP